jgi:ketosteroid isomerase-like protein
MTENSELIRAVYAGFAAGNMPAVVGAFHDDIRWTEAAGFPYGGTCVGPDAVVTNVFARLGSEWEGFSAVPHRFVAEGDTVVALGDYGGTYKATGRSFTAPFAHVWTLRDGKVAEFQQHTDTVLVRAALG